MQQEPSTDATALPVTSPPAVKQTANIIISHNFTVSDGVVVIAIVKLTSHSIARASQLKQEARISFSKPFKGDQNYGTIDPDRLRP